MPTIPKLSDYDIDPDALRLNAALQKTLDTTVAIYESYNAPLPLRRYWTTGRPAYDCEQVVVSYVQGYLGFPGGDGSQANNCDVPRSAVMEISVVRPAAAIGTSGKTPSPEAIQAASEWTGLDAWVLLESVNLFDKWDELGGRGPGVIATVRAEEAQGGYQAVVLMLTVAVP